MASTRGVNLPFFPSFSIGGSDVGGAMPSRSMSDPDQEFDKEVR